VLRSPEADAQGIAPFVAVDMATYDSLRANLPLWTPNPASWHFLVCGAAAGAAAQTATYPLDLVRRRIQVQVRWGHMDTDTVAWLTTTTQDFLPNAPKYNGMMHAFRSIVRDEGVLGLYRGMVPCYLKVCVFV
jgi:solute carrier family 25 phosphate transporter 23/24/25/41